MEALLKISHMSCFSVMWLVVRFTDDEIIEVVKGTDVEHEETGENFMELWETNRKLGEGSN